MLFDYDGGNGGKFDITKMASALCCMYYTPGVLIHWSQRGLDASGV
jgi:hypothetical protein